MTNLLKSKVQFEINDKHLSINMKTRTKSIKQNISIIQNCKLRKVSYDNKNQNKPKTVNQNFIKPPKSCTKQNQQANKYLRKTLNILSQCFNIKNNESVIRSSSILNLSSSVYKIVKGNISVIKKMQNDDKQNIISNANFVSCKNKQPKIKDEILKGLLDKKQSSSKNNRDSRKVIMSRIQNCHQGPSSTLANYPVSEVPIINQHNSVIINPNVPYSENSIFVKRRSNSTLDSYFRQKFGTNAQDEQAVQKKLRVIKALKKSQQIVNKSNRNHIQSSMTLTNCDIVDNSIVMEKLKNKKSQKLK